MGKGVIYDLKAGLKSILRRPAASLIVIGTVAIAIGGTTSVFSVVNGVLLRPLSFPDSDRMVRLYQVKRDWLDSPNSQLRAFANQFPLSVPTLNDWVAADLGFEAVGAWSDRSYLNRIDGRLDLIPGQAVTSGFFGAAAVPAELGRTLSPADDEIGAPSVAVLGHGLWQERFGGDPDVVGSAIILDGQPYDVIGVMPASFAWPNREARIWTTLSEEEKAGGRSEQFLSPVARLADSVTMASAEQRLAALQIQLEEAWPDDQGELGSRVESFLTSIVGDIRATLWLLLGSVALVLIIACLNIANVLSVQALDRRRELAVKSALGAGAGRLIRAMLGESLILTGVGGALGIGIAWVTLPLLVSLVPGNVPRVGEVGMEPGVVVFGLVVTLLTGLVVGSLPALQAAGADPGEMIKSQSKGGGDRSGNRLRAGLVVGEVGLAFTLLVGAGLIGVSFSNLWTTDRGFATEGLLQMVLSEDPEADPSRELRNEELSRIREQLAAIPGVEVTAANQTPLTGSMSSTTYQFERPEGEPENYTVVISSVIENYFEVMEIPLVEGRSLASSDVDGAPLVGVVNQSLAQTLWPGESPLGKRIRSGSEAEWTEVVGVVQNVRHQGLNVLPEPKLYVPVWQNRRASNQWLLRARGDLGAVEDLARAAATTAAPGRAVRWTAILDETIARSVAVERFRSIFSISLAGLAAVLALLGVYGVVAFAVGQRSREIAVRIAMGARSVEVVRSVVGQGLLLSLAGVALGLGLTFLVGGQVAGFLYEVEVRDVRVLSAMAIVVVGVSLLAAWLPARRVAGIDPVTVLRSD